MTKNYYPAMVCPYCREAILVENFCNHAHSVHNAKVPLTMTFEEIEKRFAILGGVVSGKMDDDGKFYLRLG